MDTQQQQQHEHHAPEVVHPDYPEAVAPQQYQQQYQQQQPQFQYNQPQQYQQYQQFPPNAAYKPEDAQGAYTSTAYSGSQLDPTSPRPQNAVPGAGAQAPGGEKKKGTICGCTSIVFVLCAIIALLSAAVIGLAAGTGVEASRANSAENRAAELSSSLASATSAATATGTAGSSSATSTSFAALDRNCSADPTAVTGTTYDAFSLYGNYSFTIQCNKDTKGGPLIALFAADFDTCMDHCASYSNYLPKMFGSNNTNTTCGGVSFIPLWTTKPAALKGGAPGNCYLKPKQTGDLDDPNIGTECHAAVLN
ncbi:hypothetical protein N8I77_001229 [Diaporthe amygdali]|uniref:Uncharacterized protein n=1 Tax=Phomopsis amygdali TaxID=1214568 RepID=A0AAD9SQI0_PHOAM|nr:hypothetical protein N8I77_001229 [Diaporthe amygdali]